jgi:hypothetical protein
MLSFIGICYWPPNGMAITRAEREVPLQHLSATTLQRRQLHNRVMPSCGVVVVGVV